MNWIPYGPDAWLLRFAGQLGPETFLRGRAIAMELERHPPAGLREFVPGFTTMLLEFEPGASPESSASLAVLTDRLQAAFGSSPAETEGKGEVKEIPVIYDGPDLVRVAEARGLTVAQVAALHSAPLYHVYLLGFSPGFPYLGDLDPRLHTPRLSSPRPRIPAGSVAIGGAHTGIYSVDSPGGWNIIGRTSVKLFDLTRGRDGNETAVFWLAAGDRVRFMPVLDERPSHG